MRPRAVLRCAGAAERFYRYAAFLLAQNEKMNLTALKTLQAVADGHFLDSLAPAAMGLIPDGSRIIDIGCGPGLPELPLRFALENSEVTLERQSQRKRVRFMEEFIADTGLSGAKPVCARAEALAADPAYRERFDVAVSRAVAGLSVLCELCPLSVRASWRDARLQGPGRAGGGGSCARAVSALGGRLRGVENVICGRTGRNTVITIIEKTANHKIYPS